MHSKHKPHIHPHYPGTCAGKSEKGKPCCRNLGRGAGSGAHVVHETRENDGFGAVDTMTLYCVDHCPICAEERKRRAA